MDTNQLYDKSIELLRQIKLTQGNTALNSTLRRHVVLRKFLLVEQVKRLKFLESSAPDVTLDNN